jgi:osmotically-inducible protein OsmY
MARGDDKEIARQIISKLKEHQAAGRLQGFDIDLKVEGGVVWVKGRLDSAQQESLVLETARLTPGVSKVMENIDAPAASPEAKIAERAGPEAQPMRPAQISPTPAPTISSRRPQVEETRQALVTAPASPIATQPVYPVTMAAAISVSPPSAPVPATTVAAKAELPATSNQDHEITQRVIGVLKNEKAAGRLAGSDVSFKVDGGVVWIKGHIVSADQEAVILQAVQRVPGVVKIMKNLETTDAPGNFAASQTAQSIAIDGSGRATQASAVQPAQSSVLKSANAAQGSATPASPAALQKAGPAAPQLAPVNPYYAYPYAGYYAAMPQTPYAFAPAQPASAEMSAEAGVAAGAAGPPPGVAPYAPAAPMHAVSAYGGAGVRYDHPHLPAYAWPSYAAYPNYAAVTYPKQYSPTVWPYIGPFYPYPQVPLGWRKVVLEWDDGWWQLDFKDQSRPWKMR